MMYFFFQTIVPCMVKYFKPNQIEVQFVRHPAMQWLFAGMHTNDIPILKFFSSGYLLIRRL
jgi:hypothetical protein